MWQVEQAQLCDDCGHSLSVTTLDEAQFDYEAETVTCAACLAREMAVEARDVGPGTKWLTRRRR